MSETPAQTVPMEALRKGFSSDAGSPLVLTIPDHPADPDNFYSWPTRLGAPLPGDFLQKIKASREAAPLLAFRDVTRKGQDGSLAKSGYSYGGEKSGTNPTAIVSPSEAADPKLKEVVLKVYDEMHEEGGISAVMTGDAAFFTWGRGISFLSPALAIAFRDFIQQSPSAKTALLDCGMTITGSTNEDWRIVDTATGTVKSGREAIDLLDGPEPADEKKRMLSAIAKITAENMQEASNAQWAAFKRKFMYTGHQKVPAEVIATWPPESVAYVVHAGAYGNFLNGWPEYSQTRGDLAKILRIAAKRNKHIEKDGHILVPAQSGSANPSTTLLFGMGKQIMVKRGIVKPLPGYPGSERPGDIVFEIVKARQTTATGTHMVLRGPTPPFDFETWVDANHGKSMSDLLKACEDLGYEQLRRTRDWYARIDPATGMPAEKWGPRPRVAMDAVLHKGEGEGGRWVLDDAGRAGISPTQSADQYQLLKAKLGIA